MWFRFLLLTYTGTGLTFAVMLTIVLAGIGLGGLTAGKLAHHDEHCHRWLAHLTAFSGLMVVATYYGFDLFTAQQSRESATLVPAPLAPRDAVGASFCCSLQREPARPNTYAAPR